MFNEEQCGSINTSSQLHQPSSRRQKRFLRPGNGDNTGDCMDKDYLHRKEIETGTWYKILPMHHGTFNDSNLQVYHLVLNSVKIGMEH